MSSWCRRQSEIKSIPELIAKAKANPGKLNWTSPGAGTTPYLAGELLKLRTGISMQHIPFPGAGPATTAVLAGQVDAYVANLGSVVALIDAGKVRPIAVTAEQRWRELPDVPTLDELGVKDAVSDTFQAVYAPAGTPQAVVDRLAKELDIILARPDVKEKYVKAGLPWSPRGPMPSASASPTKCRCTRRSSTRRACGFNDLARRDVGPISRD